MNMINASNLEALNTSVLLELSENLIYENVCQSFKDLFFKVDIQHMKATINNEPNPFSTKLRRILFDAEFYKLPEQEITSKMVGNAIFDLCIDYHSQY